MNCEFPKKTRFRQQVSNLGSTSFARRMGFCRYRTGAQESAGADSNSETSTPPGVPEARRRAPRSGEKKGEERRPDGSADGATAIQLLVISSERFFPGCVLLGDNATNIVILSNRTFGRELHHRKGFNASVYLSDLDLVPQNRLFPNHSALLPGVQGLNQCDFCPLLAGVFLMCRFAKTGSE